MVYSCIGAEIEDSDGSSASDIKVTDDSERSTAISDAPADTRSNGHAVVSSKQQTDRQMDAGRQERIVPITDQRTEHEDDAQAGDSSVAPCGARPEPPPQNTKPSLAVMRQRHLQESSGTAVAPQSVHLENLHVKLPGQFLTSGSKMLDLYKVQNSELHFQLLLIYIFCCYGTLQTLLLSFFLIPLSI